MPTKKELQEELMMNQLMNQASNSQITNEKINSPETNFESSVFLVENSKLTDNLPEVDKEIKLANLDVKEKEQVNAFFFAYHDLLLIHDLQMKKYKENLSEDQFKQFKKISPDFKLDQLNFLRKGISVSTISRGFGGFERLQQNTVISKADFNAGVEDQQTSRLNKLLGGFRK